MKKCHHCGKMVQDYVFGCEHCFKRLDVIDADTVPLDAEAATSGKEPSSAPLSFNAVEALSEEESSPVVERSFIGWCLEPFKKYAVFHGRARRREYWSFVLFNWLILGGLFALTSAFGASLESAEDVLIPLFGLYWFAILLPMIALLVRRLHDINRSGWWILLVLIPYVGPLFFLAIVCIDGVARDNRYGKDPKRALRGAA